MPKHTGTETSWAVLQRILCSTDQTSDQKPLHPYGYNTTAATRAASWWCNVTLCGMLRLTKPPAHLALDSAAWQFPGMEVHFLMEMSLCYGQQDLLQLNYTTSPCNCSCPVLISPDNYSFSELKATSRQRWNVPIRTFTYQEPQKMGVLWEQRWILTASPRCLS